MMALPHIDIFPNCNVGRVWTRAAPQHVDFWDCGQEHAIIKVCVEDINRSLDGPVICNQRQHGLRFKLFNVEVLNYLQLKSRARKFCASINILVRDIGEIFQEPGDISSYSEILLADYRETDYYVW